MLSSERRAALVEWAERGEYLIVEDDFDAELRYDRGGVGALQGLAPERVAYIGSASKRLVPGMRLGWMLSPSWLGWPLISVKAIEDRARRRLASSPYMTSSSVASSTATCDGCGCATSAGARR